YSIIAIYIAMTLESACIPVPSEIVMPYAGYLVAQGKLNMLEATLAAALANLSGSWLAYFIGKFGGRPLIKKYGKYIFLSKKHLNRADTWFNQKGEITVFISRMLPGVRTFISLPAGIARMNFIRFSLYSLFGVLPWNFALVYLGYVFTDRWNDLQSYLYKTDLMVFSGLLLIFIVYLVRWKNKQH
ncbi:MAG: DedA family protein, partial [Bacillota bacterium]